MFEEGKLQESVSQDHVNELVPAVTNEEADLVLKNE